jgi:predicted nuclease of restriction endonuclease-like RecB superfamily
LFPEAALPVDVRDGVGRLDYLTLADHAWLRLLIGEFERFSGRRQRELERRLREPLPARTPWRKRQAATIVLRRLWKTKRATELSPLRVRAEVFGEATGTAAPRADVLGRVAARLKTRVADLEETLFADLPGELLVHSPVPVPSVSEVALRVNLALAQSVLQRAATVRIRVDENIRAIVRLARLRGLLCTVRTSQACPEEGPWLEVSGPFALFRHTLVYGRALASIVPLVARCPSYVLEADCRLRGSRLAFRLVTGDPLLPGDDPARFDSRLEERFARDVARAAPDWDVLREPEAVAAAGTLVFPDFVLRHRIEPSRIWMVEIAGFWTAEYVQKKLATLRAAGIPNLILFLDEDRRCSEEDLPSGAHVVRFRRRIDAEAVAHFLEVERPHQAAR